ncbi:FRG domain-containing protein [Spirosoma horti]
MIEEKHLFIETELTEWKDIFSINDNLISQLIFRGQADSSWTVSSTMERLMNRLHPNHIDKFILPAQEGQMLKEFQWKYPIFRVKNIEDKNFVEWLSIMQHYGAATRLVDFTDSLFIATFMAIYEAQTDSSVWAINKHVISSSTYNLYISRFNTNNVSAQDLDEFSLVLANDSIGNAFTAKEKKLLIIRPQNSNERLYRQQGLFVMPNNIQISFMDQLEPLLSCDKPLFIDFKHLINISKSNKQDHFTIIKINIPQRLHLQILKNLREMNINSEILFPGIEGLAKSLNYSKFKIN